MRTNVSKHAYNDLKDMFGDILFHNVIRSNVDIAEAQARQKPITYYNNKSIGAEDYISVSNELLSKY
jgi:chromosome partitioning protein